MTYTLQNFIPSVYEWNQSADNLEYNRHLEASMLIEEVSEFIIALKNKDIVEIADAYADIITVMSWTCQKLWITTEQLNRTLSEVMESNMSKLIDDWNWNKIAMRDTWWKIIKPETYKKPDLSFFL